MSDDSKVDEGIGRRRAWLALVGVGLVLGAASLALPHDVFWHSDEGAKFVQLLNLRLGPEGLDTAIRYPGQALDPALHYVPFHPKQYRLDAGQIYLQWPIFLPLLTWPFYAVLGLGGLYVLPLAGALLACWGAYRLARAAGAPARGAWLAIPLLGLGTPLGFYSWVFFEHTLAAGLIAAATFLLIEGIPAGDRRRMAGAGLLLGAAIYLRSELYVLLPVGGVVLAWRLWTLGRAGERTAARRLLLGGAAALGGCVLALLPLWTFYLVSEGGPLPQHATWYFDSGGTGGADTGPAPSGLHLPEIRYLTQAGLGLIPDFLAGPSAPTSPTIPSWATAALIGGTLITLCRFWILDLGFWIVARLRNQPITDGGYGPKSPIPNPQSLLIVGLGLLLVASGAVLLDPQPYTSVHGFVLAAPLVVLAAGGRRRAARRPAAGLLGAITGLYIVLHVLIISALSGLGPISRYEWGQRYLLPAYPLLIALAVAAVTPLFIHEGTRKDAKGDQKEDQKMILQNPQSKIQNRLLLALAALLTLVGAGFVVRGWGVVDVGKAEARAWAAAVAASPDRAILTDRWWLPLVLAPQFYAHEWLLAPDPAQATGWPAAAAQAGLAGFSTASFTPALPSVMARTPPARPGAGTSEAGLTIRHFDLSVQGDHDGQPDDHGQDAENEAAQNQGGRQAQIELILRRIGQAEQDGRSRGIDHGDSAQGAIHLQHRDQADGERRRHE